MEKIDEHYAVKFGRETHMIVLTTERLFLFFKRRRVYYGMPKRNSTFAWRWFRLERDTARHISRWAENSLSFCVQNRPAEMRPVTQLLLAETVSQLEGIKNGRQRSERLGVAG